MKNRATLTLIELAVMLLVFALAAALCLRGFVWAEETSEFCANRDQALLRAQNAAEVLKACGGDLDEAAGIYGGSVEDGVWSVCYDNEWKQVETGGAYRLVAQPEPGGMEYLFVTDIRVLWGETCLIRLDVAGQEVAPNG